MKINKNNLFLLTPPIAFFSYGEFGILRCIRHARRGEFVFVSHKITQIPSERFTIIFIYLMKYFLLSMSFYHVFVFCQYTGQKHLALNIKAATNATFLKIIHFV